MTLDPAVAAVRSAVRRCLAQTDSDNVLVACSGGADSLALLAATLFEADRVIGVCVDHGLQSDSAEHTSRVVAQMAALGATETASVRVQVESDGRGLEAAAREARYAVLEELAARFDSSVVLLGHTLDDQAETVLLGLTRGSGGRSIAGMRPAFGVFRRPLIDVRREQTAAACRAEGIEWWDDPHNQDPRFTRSRVRHAVLPMLERELGPGIAETLARTAGQLASDLNALDAWADSAARAVGDEGIDVRKLKEYPDAIVTRVLRRAALDAGAPAAELFHVHVQALLGLVNGQGPKGPTQLIRLPGHLTAYREGNQLRFRQT